MLGYNNEAELIGQDAHDLLHHSRRDGSTYNRDNCPLFLAATRGEPARIDTENLFRADGSGFPVEYWARPIRRDGVLYGAVCTFIDITERKEREERLHLSEERLSFTNEILGVAYVDVQASGTVATHNFEDVFGRHFPADRAEAMELLRDILRSDDRDVIIAAWQNALATDGRHHLECAIHHPVKGLRYFETYIDTTLNETASKSRSLIVLMDVTEKHLAQRAITQSEQRLRRVIDGMLAYVAILDRDGTLREVNKTALKAAGLSRTDVIGRKFWECYWWTYDDDVVSGLRQDVERAATGELVRHDMVTRMADDTRLVVDFMLTPSLDSVGNVTQIVASGVDITARTEAERARNLLAEIVEQSVDFIGTSDTAGNILYVNQAGLSMTGTSLEGLSGKSIGELHPDWAYQKIVEVGLPTARSDGSWTGETALIGPDGNEFPVLQSILMHNDRDGAVTHYSNVMRDIRPLKENEEHQRFLLREILHRSKNLLAVIQAMASQTARTSPSPDQFVAQFKKRVQGLSASHDLLVKENWQGVPLNELVDGQLRTFLSVVDKSRIRIMGPPVILTTTAAQAVGLALHELGTNAVKYGSLSTRRGCLTITWDTVLSDDGEQRLIMNWVETRGPDVAPPSRTGFGVTVIQDMIAQSLDCEVVLQYAPEGFRWTMDAPATCLVPRDDEPVSSRALPRRG